MLTEFSFWVNFGNFPFNNLTLLCYRELYYKVGLSRSVQIQKWFLLWPIKQKAEERRWRFCLRDRLISAGQQSSPRIRGSSVCASLFRTFTQSHVRFLTKTALIQPKPEQKYSSLSTYMLLNTSATCQWYVKYVFSQNKQKFSGELGMSAVIWLKQKWRAWKQDIKHEFESEAHGGTLLCAVRIHSADRIWQLPTLRDSPTPALSSLILMSQTVVS